MPDFEQEELTPTGHVIGATYRSSYWGGDYKVIGPAGPYGVEVECVRPGGGAHQTVGTRWTHMTHLDRNDLRLDKDDGADIFDGRATGWGYSRKV